MADAPNESSASQQQEQSANYEAGLAVRRDVMSAAFVDRSLGAASEFARPLQELTTSFAWGQVWTRPGLSRRDRSLLNLGMLAALNRSTELGGHVRGALRNGVTEAEIQEVVIQSAVYCGFPAALEACRVAEANIQKYKEELDAEKK